MFQESDTATNDFEKTHTSAMKGKTQVKSPTKKKSPTKTKSPTKQKGILFKY